MQMQSNDEPQYYIEPRLKESLDKIRDMLSKKDRDYVLVVDGAEGSGKSLFAMQVGAYVDRNLSLDRICMSPQQFKEAIINAKKGECVIFDEAFTGLSSRSTLSEVNRMLVSLMMQMRQKNLFVIVVLPSFFLLDKYVSLFRARSLIHIYSKESRHYWVGYNARNKKNLYLSGYKTLSYGKFSRRITFKGRFYGKYPINEEEYRKKKARALEEMEKTIEKGKYITQRDKLFWILNQEYKVSIVKLAKLCKKYDIQLKKSAIHLILTKFKEEQA